MVRFFMGTANLKAVGFPWLAKASRAAPPLGRGSNPRRRAVLSNASPAAHITQHGVQQGRQPSRVALKLPLAACSLRSDPLPSHPAVLVIRGSARHWGSLACSPMPHKLLHTLDPAHFTPAAQKDPEGHMANSQQGLVSDTSLLHLHAPCAPTQRVIHCGTQLHVLPRPPDQHQQVVAP